MNRSEILKIVEEKEKDRDFRNKCLSTDTCFKCGGELYCDELWQDGGRSYKCRRCGAKFSR